MGLIGKIYTWFYCTRDIKSYADHVLLAHSGLLSPSSAALCTLGICHEGDHPKALLLC